MQIFVMEGEKISLPDFFFFFWGESISAFGPYYSIDPCLTLASSRQIM
jgi:hypothetical protein